MEQINEQKKAIVDEYGEWTMHNIHLGDGVYTMSEEARGGEVFARRVLQIVADLVNRPLKTIRVLDLACLEGLYAVEFALHGASALGIEIREANLAKARFVKKTLALNNLELLQDDVRNLSAAKYGLFDAVLCLGILYHLDAPDVFDFVHRMGEVCGRCLVIDTHISLTKEVSFRHGGKEYWGSYFIEHKSDASAEDREKQLWASIDNPQSLWLTRPSLYNLLAHAGFTSVYECYNPPLQHQLGDRFTLLAIKGEPQDVFSSPSLTTVTTMDWAEQAFALERNIAATTAHPLTRVGRLLPSPVKRIIKKLLP